jgi:hypothetical protein
MPAPRGNQKQIAQRYAGNLRYFNRLHPLRRARVLIPLVCFLAAAVAAFFYLRDMRSSSSVELLNSPGAISQAHNSFARDCQKCHDSAVRLDLLKPALGTVSIDVSCENCHTRHTFHEADVAVDHSCTSCHHEHLGAGPMPPVADINCASCHGNAAIMAASAQKAQTLPASDFEKTPKDFTLIDFHPPRSPNGRTEVFRSFEDGHPDFQIQRDHLIDSNTLKFDHRIHLSGAIPLVDGRKLTCAYCHQPDSRGAYMQPINYARNCQACHALQIDPTLADFQIPHPTGASGVNSVRDFILTLPTQYAVYATQKGMTSTSQVASFVSKHMLAIRQRVRRGADLEREVFFADDRNVDYGAPMPATARERALFPGCAYCHEVKASPTGEPVVTKPVTPDRWYIHAKFDHAAHASMSCLACHGAVAHSEKTSDISLPDKASCVTCHSAKGGVVSTCVICHDYHNDDPLHITAAPESLKAMLLQKP